MREGNLDMTAHTVQFETQFSLCPECERQRLLDQLTPIPSPG